MPEEKKKWERAFSAGGVVFKKEGGKAFLLLINPRRPNFGPPQDHWTFPKGLVDKGEDKQSAALREVKEEGGVVGKIIAPLGYVKFFRRAYDHDGNVLKFVDYFLMEYIEGDPKDHDDEVADAKWYPMEEVEDKLKFPHDKEIYNKARRILDGKE